MEIHACDHHFHTTWSDQNKMEEDEADLKIVECLRGRLLAERAASKAAKQDEHLIDSKLKELEAQLRNETKARKRFEKKLSFLKKKLQSLKIATHILDDLQESRSSSFDNFDSSCISSISSNEEQPQQEANLQTTNSSSDQTSEGPSDDDYHTFQECPIQEATQMDNESACLETDAPSPKLEMEDNNGEVDNSMALIPSGFAEEQSEDPAAKEVVNISSENRRQVLGTLKDIREEIHRTMKRRQATTTTTTTMKMIQVG